MIGYQLREAKDSDAGWLFGVYRKTLKPSIDATWGWDEKFQQNAFSEHLPVADWTIITKNQQELGGFIIRQKTTHLWLEMIIVAPEFQRQGVGHAAVDYFKELAALNDHAIRLSVMKVNPADEFYRSRGFTQFDQDDWTYKLQWQARTKSK